MTEGTKDNPPVVRRRSPAPVEIRQDTAEAVAERLNKRTFRIHLYTDGPHDSLNVPEAADFLKRILGEKHFPVDIRSDFISYWLKSATEEQKTKFVESMVQAKRWAVSRSRFSYGLKPITEDEKIELERELIKKVLQDEGKGFIGDKLNGQRIEKDGRQVPVYNNDYYVLDELMGAYRQLINQQELNINNEGVFDIHLILTGRGVASTEIKDAIHCRGGQFSPGLGIISTTGFLDGPIGPVDYEKALVFSRQSGFNFFSFPPEEHSREEIYRQVIKQQQSKKPPELDTYQALREAYSDKMLQQNDPRMTEIAKGFCLQAIFSGAGENGHCSHSDPNSSEPDLSKTCRFHDAHWQEEMLNCQIPKEGKPQLCDYHQRIFDLLEK